MNYKTEQQYQFEQNINTLGQQFSIYENPTSSAKLNQEKIKDFATKLKNLTASFNRMDQRLKSNMRNKNYNEFDIKNKLKKHLQNVQKMRERYRKLEQKVVDNQKAALMKDRTLNAVQLDDFKRADDHRNRAQALNKQAQETLGIVTDTYAELNSQNRRLKQIDEDAGQFEHELSMSDQLLRVIANRELVTKLMLVLLVFFLGLADVLILLIKVLGR